MNQLPSKLGANNTLFQHDRPNQPNSSSFDLSRFTNFTLDAGMIVPFDTIPTLPGDEFDINFDMLLDTLPLVLPSITQYKVVTHWYYQKCRDMWKGWKTFSTKGRTGNISKTIPKLDLEYGFYGFSTNDTYGQSIDIKSECIYSSYGYNLEAKVFPVGYHSLSAFLGVPPLYSGIINSPTAGNYIVKEAYRPYSYLYSSSGSPTVQKAFNDLIPTGHNSYRYPNALPFVMYQSIVKHNYVNQNLLQNNTALFPEEGDDDWILPYNAGIVNYIGRGEVDNSFNHANTDPDGNPIVECRYDGVFTNLDNRVRLDCLRYAQFSDDPFTTGLPWLQRGDTTTLKNDITIEDSTFDFDDVTGSGFAQVMAEIGDLYAGIQAVNQRAFNPDINANVFRDESTPTKRSSGLFRQTNEAIPDGTHLGVRGSDIASLIQNLTGKLSLSGGTIQGSFTANQLRELLATSVWQERNARVDGSYNKMIFQHWRVNPNSEEHMPIYIGGTADYISFATILQNSESTSNAPLGSMAGYGSSKGSSRVCSGFYSPDYGYIMGIMIITPVTTYSQGVEHHLSCMDSFEDCVQPEFEGLSPEPQLVKEIYVADNDTDNENLLNYQERYMYYKVRMNQNRGMFYSAPDKDILFSAMVQSRWFSSVPEFSYQFLCMSPDNIRRDWLAYPSQPMFRVQTSSQVFVNKRRLAYASAPNTFGF